MERKYTYKLGFIKPRVPAQIVGEHLEELEKQYGYVRPDMMVETARPESSPIHDLFEWNDQAAAELYRISQAEYTLRSLCIVVEQPMTEPVKPVTVRARMLVEEPETGRAVYASWDTIAGNEDYTQQVLHEARREIVAAQAKLATIEHALRLTNNWQQKLQVVIDELDAATTPA